MAPTPSDATPLVLLLFASTLTVMAGAILSPVVEVVRGALDLSGTQAGLMLYGLAGRAGPATASYSALLAGRVLFGLGAAAVFTGSTVAIPTLYRG